MIDVKRTPAPPASLSKKKSWLGDDVLDRLHDDFLGKCYLTEVPVARGGFEVDHRHPRSQAHPSLHDLFD